MAWVLPGRAWWRCKLWHGPWLMGNLISRAPQKKFARHWLLCPELASGQHNTSRCAHWGNPTRFPRRTWCSGVWEQLAICPSHAAHSTREPMRGGRGEVMQPCICGAQRPMPHSFRPHPALNRRADLTPEKEFLLAVDRKQLTTELHLFYEFSNKFYKFSNKVVLTWGTGQPAKETRHAILRHSASYPEESGARAQLLSEAV